MLQLWMEHEVLQDTDKRDVSRIYYGALIALLEFTFNSAEPLKGEQKLGKGRRTEHQVGLLLRHYATQSQCLCHFQPLKNPTDRILNYL